MRGSPEVPAAEEQGLSGGTRIRTLELSSALLQLTETSYSSVQELSTFEIESPGQSRQSLLSLLHEGIAYFFSRDDSGASRTATHEATAASSGTEYVVEARGGRSKFTVIDGELMVTAQGRTVTLRRGERAVAEAGKAPVVESIEIQRLVQWWLYFPAVLDPDEVEDALQEDGRYQSYEASLAAYRRGDLPHALTTLPNRSTGLAASERAYVIGLLLAAGHVQRADSIVAESPGPRSDGGSPARGAILESAVRRLRAVIAHQDPVVTATTATATASEWLARSYERQSRYDLSGALLAARTALQLSPRFGVAHLRVAELEFSRGARRAAEAAVEQALQWVPNHPQVHAMRGFLLAAEARYGAARVAFEEAVRIGGTSANGWLGRGLVRLAQGDRRGGREDLQTAALVEPNRALLHSYLAKAFANEGSFASATKELQRAKDLDALDPTPGFFGALLNFRQNRLNEAILQLGLSLDQNDNRRVYRSRPLLDQDRAVRSANLARVYADAGLDDVALREAARAVSADYCSYSAHLFLSESYDSLRDPTRFNLRYETAWFNELLLANLLAPVGAGALSTQVSQEDYSRLFEGDRLFLNTTTEYRSDGQFRERATQGAVSGPVSYTLDLEVQHNDGIHPNNDLSRFEGYYQVKAQPTPEDTVLLLLKYESYESGDNFQRFDPSMYSSTLRLESVQDPQLLLAYHREWRPGMHTLVLLTRLVDEQRLLENSVNESVGVTNLAGQLISLGTLGLDPTTGRDIGGMDLAYANDLEIYGGELSQVWQSESVLLLAGLRAQTGHFDTRSDLSNVVPSWLARFFGSGPQSTSIRSDLRRVSAYAYAGSEIVPRLWATVGVTFDDLTYPRNYRHPPVAAGESNREQVSPKASLVWRPRAEVTVRALYSRALGGVSFDESYRLEPTQLAGFLQAYRTVIPETIVGSLAAPRYDIYGAALDLRLRQHTFVGLQAGLIDARVDREVGIFYDRGLLAQPPWVAGTMAERIGYSEPYGRIAWHRLLGAEWAISAEYGYTQSRLSVLLPAALVEVNQASGRRERAELHQGKAALVYHHPSGFFGTAEVLTFGQRNHGYEPPLVSTVTIQYNLYAGFRFWQRRGELVLGGLNLSGEDYRLNPLNFYPELPRERVLYARARLNF